MEDKWKFGKAKVFAGLEIAKVHFVSPDGKHARCDKNIEVVIENDLAITDVTCAKCKRYADYKAATSEPNKTPAKKKAPARSKKKPESPEVKVAPEPEPAPELKSPEPEDGYKEKLKAAQKPPELEPCAVHFVAGTSPNKKHFIKHVPTGKTMFNDVNEKALKTCVKYLNNVKIKWEDGTKTVPKDFIAAIRGAFQAAYKSHGLETKVTGTPPDETPEEAAEKATQEALALLTPTSKVGSVVSLPSGIYKLTKKGWIIQKEEKDIPKTRDIPETSDIPKTRKIKRRQKKDTPKTSEKGKRKIKRRAKKPATSKKKDTPKTNKRTIKRRKAGRQLDKYGFNIGEMRAFIVGLMEKGATAQSICKKTAKKFMMDESTVMSKIQMVIRVLRKRKIPVTVVIFETKEKDYYHLADPR